MLRRAGWAPSALLLALALGCAAGGTREVTSTAPSPAASLTVASSTAVTTSPATEPTATPTPRPVRIDIRADRLTIPGLGIDEVVQGSRVIVDTSPPTPGCPAPPPGQETFTVPDQGIATPVDAIEGLENKAWIFGHSRWQNVPGVLFRLQDLNVGDELFVDGVDRRTGDRITRQRFVVSGLYLADIDSGGVLVTAGSPTAIPTKPLVILQTSAREDGANKSWILDQQKVVAKSQNVIQGDVNDPCKYLLLFVFAQAS